MARLAALAHRRRNERDHALLPGQADESVGRYVRDAKRRPSFELHCIDAADFPLPAEPLVIFLYNPFDRPVMQQVARNVRAACRSARQDVYVVYLNPFHRSAWDAAGFREFASGGHFVVFTRDRD